MAFSHLFTKQASSYRKFRPVYPEALFDFLAKQCRGTRLAWDCGTGNGQAARALAKRFSKVIATDVAEAQIREAVEEERVSFLVAPAEAVPLETGSVDLVTVAQAVHWFQLEKFYAEARRVLAPGGLIAIWGYGYFTTTSTLQATLDEYGRRTLGDYWTGPIKLVQEGYRNLPFPFEKVGAPTFTISADWNLAQLKGYFDSWSATQAYKDAHGGLDPFELLAPKLATLWGPPEKTVRFDWEIFLKVGRV